MSSTVPLPDPEAFGVSLRDAARTFADPRLREQLIAAESAWYKVFGTPPMPVEFRTVEHGSVKYLSVLDMWQALGVPVVPPLVQAREAVEVDLIGKIAKGLLLAFGHRDRVDARCEQIKPILFASLEPDPNEPGRLVGGGTVFWNVIVIDPSGGATKSGKSTAAATGRTKQWLIGLMRDPNQPALRKADASAYATNKFEVSLRGFNRAWRDAIAETGADHWSKAGPKVVSGSMR